MTKYGLIIYGWLAGIPYLITPAMAQLPMLPPPEYDHEFKGVYTVTRAKSIEAVGRLCNNPLAGLGCSILLNNGMVCSIFMAPDHVIRSRGVKPEDVKRHEIAHCNGWGKDHPGGIVIPRGT
jgi:hypothetical protein